MSQAVTMAVGIAWVRMTAKKASKVNSLLRNQPGMRMGNKSPSLMEAEVVLASPLASPISHQIK